MYLLITCHELTPISQKNQFITIQMSDSFYSHFPSFFVSSFYPHKMMLSSILCGSFSFSSPCYHLSNIFKGYIDGISLYSHQILWHSNWKKSHAQKNGTYFFFSMNISMFFAWLGWFIKFMIASTQCLYHLCFFLLEITIHVKFSQCEQRKRTIELFLWWNGICPFFL